MTSCESRIATAAPESGGEPACFNLPVGATVKAYLGLGSNIGDRGAHLRDALTRIAAIAEIEKCSTIYQSEPVGYVEQPEFWNMVARISTDLPALQLLAELHAIEAAMGRERSIRNGPRNIDIDILLYDSVVQKTDELELPHPRMQERAFVLKPLLEIEPHIRDPRTRNLFADYLNSQQLERADIVAPAIQVDDQTR
jgi:2-amino-4-hydroxy-6-hydroxymethyldihydropteridine diphosphokinase